MGIKQTVLFEIWALARLNTLKYGYWPDQDIGIKETKKSEIWVLTTQNTP